MSTKMIGLLAALVVAACSPQADAQASATPAPANSEIGSAIHPVSGLRVTPLTITAAGQVHSFDVEVAATDEEQAQGYMFRTEIGDFEGMIFPSKTPQLRSFWMKNTPLPLDIIYIGVDSRILNIHAMTTPYSLESYASDGPAIAVLELRGGRAEELGIEPGDLVQWEE
ncbi:DUF192 domain-containing protein [Erythrobacter sp. W53]|uniref:DUF192 domain-containing protein n=1 Tax=Erythrobacter sp. W53 TaxID=3425947 RepID=UPI003D767E11